MNRSTLNILVFAVCIGVIGAVGTSRAMQPEPLPPDASPREAIERLVVSQPGWPGQSLPSAIVARIEREPEKFAPVIKEVFELPDRLSEFDMDAPLARRIYYRNTQMFGHGVFDALGRERAEGILVPYFRRAFELFKQAEEQLAAIREQAKAAPAEKEDVQAKFELLQRQHRAAMSMMSLAVWQLGRMNSPALVDDMLKFWEAGYVDRQTNLPRYPLMFAHERPDVIPRLRALMADPKIDRQVKFEIKRAFEWYASTLAEAEEPEPLAVAEREEEGEPQGADEVPAPQQPR